MAHNLSQEKLIEYKTAFEFYDKDGDGTITLKELGAILKNLGKNPTQKQLEQMYIEIDSDGNGEIDFYEFVAFINKKMKDLDIEEELKEAFNVFDQDGNKVLTSHELGVIFSNLKGIPGNEIDEIIREADLDNDGYIDYEEFIRAMKHK